MTALAASVLLLVTATSSLTSELQVIHQWNLADFNFPYDFDVPNNYKPKNIYVSGFEVTEDRIFLTLPRFRSGVPATLAVISRHWPAGSSPRLQAYPAWNVHEVGRNVSNFSCSSIISVSRIRRDSCGRLWVLDSGLMNLLEDSEQLCMPKFLVIDLNTNQVVRTIVLPKNTLKPNSVVTNFVIDETTGRCDDAFAYIADTDGPGLIVYDSANNSAWRITHPSMYPNPDFSDFTFPGETITLMDGIIGITHSLSLGMVYFQPLTTNKIFSVPTDFLKKGPPTAQEKIPITTLGKKSSQGMPLLIDPRDNTLYFNTYEDTSIVSFNVINGQQKRIAYDPERLLFPTDMKWSPIDSEAIWILSKRLHKFSKGTVSPNETNIWLIRIPITNFNHIFFNNFYFKK